MMSNRPDRSLFVCIIACTLSRFYKELPTIYREKLIKDSLEKRKFFTQQLIRDDFVEQKFNVSLLKHIECSLAPFSSSAFNDIDGFAAIVVVSVDHATLTLSAPLSINNGGEEASLKPTW